MKYLLYLLFFFYFCLSIQAQNKNNVNCISYDCWITEAKKSLKVNDYKAAIHDAMAALSYDENKYKEIYAFKNSVFKIQELSSKKNINDAKSNANKLKKQQQAREQEYESIIQQKDSLERHCKNNSSNEKGLKQSDFNEKLVQLKQEGDNAINRTRRILSKVHFFNDVYGLAYDSDSLGFGFIDRTGKTKIRFIYEEALTFETNGYAKVKRDGDYYLIDTLGREYRLATEIADLNASITAVDLRNKSLKEFPKELLNQTQINIILLANNKLKKMPKKIGKFSQLKKIDLRNNGFKVFPSELLNVKSLQSLDISNNEIEALPKTIGKMESLQNIDLRYNKIQKLPTTMGNLKKLEDLKLWANKITLLPSELGSLSKLKSIDASENKLKEIPVGLTNAKSLVNLNVSKNEITSIPAEISNLTNLENLNISNNSIEALPESITAMTSLVSLDVRNNQLKNLPTNISKLGEVIAVSGNTALTQKDMEELNPTNDGVPVPTPDFTEKDLALDLVFIQGGSFMMGIFGYKYEEAQHRVRLSDFYIGKTEVTQKQWRTVMGTNPSSFKGCDACPVENVSWNDIQEFLAVLNKKNPSSMGKRVYRLPTEAEWEYAAIGGNESNGYMYSGSNNLNDVGWFNGNSDNKSHPVAGKKANELGLYDMSGNVWEWCQDWYDENYYKNSPSNNPIGANLGSYRVFRGGGWFLDLEYCRTTLRSNNTPNYKSYGVGFRLCSFF